MHVLEQSGLLNRAIEFLPTDKQLAELKAARKGLTRPEIAVLLAYSKMDLYQQLLSSSLPDESYFTADLKRYFPKTMQQDFESAIVSHPLKREIIATVMTNSMVNRAGITFAFELMQDMGASARDAAAAYAIIRDGYGLRAMWNAIEATELAVDAATQAEMHASIHRFLSRAAAWLLAHFKRPLDIDHIGSELLPAIALLKKQQDAFYSDATRTLITRISEALVKKHVPEALAMQIATLEVMAYSLDIIALTKKSKLGVAEAGKLYFELGEALELTWLQQAARKIQITTAWDRQALQALISSLFDEQRRLALSVIAAGEISQWQKKQASALEHYNQIVHELRVSDLLDIPKLMVALKQLSTLE